MGSRSFLGSLVITHNPLNMSLIKLSGYHMIGFGSELGSSGSNLDPNFIHFETDPLGVRFKLSIAKSLSRTMLK